MPKPAPLSPPQRRFSARPRLLLGIDRFVGVPVCWLLTVARRLFFWTKPPEPLGREGSILFLKLAEQGSTVLAHAAIQAAVNRVGRQNVYFLVFEENRFIVDVLGLIPPQNVIAVQTGSAPLLVASALRKLLDLRRQRISACIDMEFFTRASAAIAYLTGARIRVAIPGGEALAARTFNPRLGVAGGLSILGTQGRVRPFSLEAVRVTIDCGLNVTRAAGHDRVGLVPGHLGERALRAWTDTLPVVEVSNEWGHALDAAAAKGFRALLLAGHPGKLAKLAEGCFDTHSARSPSPLPRVRALAEALTGHPAAASPTLEGLFQALDPAERRRLAEHLAGSVAQAARRRTGLPCAVLLTTMAAGVYGGCTEGTPWA